MRRIKFMASISTLNIPIKAILMIAMAISLNGCILKRGVVSYKYDQAMDQCNKYGGVYGTLPIETEGVFDTSDTRPNSNDILGRASIFLGQGLNYVEFPKEVAYVTAGDPYGRKAPYFKNEYTLFNYYRAYISESGDPLCSAYYKFIQKNSSTFEKSNLSKSQCVAVEGFDNPALLKAPFELTTTHKTIDEGIEIDWTNIEIIERRSGKNMAGLNSFVKCLTRKVSVGGGQGKECSSVSGTEKYEASCPEGSKNFSSAHEKFPYSAFTFNRGKK